MFRLALCSSLVLLVACGAHKSSPWGDPLPKPQGEGETLKPVTDPAELLALAIQSNDAAESEKQLQAGYPVNQPLKTGRPPLHEATKWKRANLMRLFLRKGADASLLDAEGLDAFAHAGENKSLIVILRPELAAELQRRLFEGLQTSKQAIVKSALLDGADPNLENDDGETALSFAIQLKFENGVRVLLLPDFTTDVNLANRRGERPLAIARRLQLSRIENLLRQRGATDQGGTL